MSSWSSRIFHKSAPIHNSHSGLGGNPAPQINHDPHLLTSPALPPHFRPPSSASALSSASTTHPYSMVSTPHQYNSAHDMDDEGECPVCLEPLSFSFRLPGEKPHIVPECGHALHEVSHLIHTHSKYLLLTRFSRPASALSMALLPPPVVLVCLASPILAYVAYAGAQ